MQFTKPEFVPLSSPVAAQWMLNSLPTGRQTQYVSVRLGNCSFLFLFPHRHPCRRHPCHCCLLYTSFWQVKGTKFRRVLFNFIRCVMNAGALKLIILPQQHHTYKNSNVTNVSHCCHVFSALFGALDRCFLCAFDNLLTWQQILLIHVDYMQPGRGRLLKWALLYVLILLFSADEVC